ANRPHRPVHLAVPGFPGAGHRDRRAAAGLPRHRRGGSQPHLPRGRRRGLDRIHPGRRDLDHRLGCDDRAGGASAVIDVVFWTGFGLFLLGAVLMVLAAVTGERQVSRLSMALLAGSVVAQLAVIAATVTGVSA